MASCNIPWVTLNWTCIACFKLCSEIDIFHHKKIIFIINTARELAIFLFIRFTNAIMNPDFAQHSSRLMGPNGETDHGSYPVYFTFFGGKGTMNKYRINIFFHIVRNCIVFLRPRTVFTELCFHHLAGEPVQSCGFQHWLHYGPMWEALKKILIPRSYSKRFWNNLSRMLPEYQDFKQIFPGDSNTKPDWEPLKRVFK